MSDRQQQLKMWFHERTAVRGVPTMLSRETGLTPTQISRMRNLDASDPKKYQRISDDALPGIARALRELPPGYEAMTHWLPDDMRSDESAAREPLLVPASPKAAVKGAVRNVPVLSMVSASNLRDQPAITKADIERWIKVADLPEGDWFALGVEGDSMNRIAPDGSIILVNRADHRLLDGRFYVFSIESGAATFKQFRRKPERLQPYSTNPEHFSIPASEEIYVVGRVRRVITDV